MGISRQECWSGLPFPSSVDHVLSELSTMICPSWEIQPAHPKGNQSWIFIRLMLKDWFWSWNSNTLVTWCEELTHLKKPWCWERLKVGGEGDNRGWDGWMASLTRWTWVWVNSGTSDGQGGLACCSPWGCKESDTTERLNWTNREEANGKRWNEKMGLAVSN